jgi:hypothetical protein
MVSLLSPQEWRRLEPILDALLDAAPDRRGALLAEVSGGDAARRAELERVVAECERAYSLLERGAAERFASVLSPVAPKPPPERVIEPFRMPPRKQTHRPESKRVHPIPDTADIAIDRWLPTNRMGE